MEPVIRFGDILFIMSLMSAVADSKLLMSFVFSAILPSFALILSEDENIQSACAMYIVLLNELRSRSKSSSPSSGEKSSHSTMVASLYK